MSNQVDNGHLGFGTPGGRGVEFHIFQNRVAQGLLATAPTAASTQATGTGASDFNIDLTPGILVVDGQALEFAAQANYDLASSGTQQMASGQSRVYALYAYRSQADGMVRLAVKAGTAATTGSQVAPTNDEIAALYPEGTKFVRITDVTVNRTGDTTVTQSQNNLVRPLWNQAA